MTERDCSIASQQPFLPRSRSTDIINRIGDCPVGPAVRNPVSHRGQPDCGLARSDNTDLDTARDAVVFMTCSRNADHCTSASRRLVQDTTDDAFDAKLTHRTNAIIVRHPIAYATKSVP